MDRLVSTIDKNKKALEKTLKYVEREDAFLYPLSFLVMEIEPLLRPAEKRALKDGVAKIYPLSREERKQYWNNVKLYYEEKLRG